MINNNTKIILASKSPRRKEILEKAGYIFDIMPSDSELNITGETYSDNLLLRCVMGKTANLSYTKEYQKLHEDYDDLLIIAADTIVVCDNTIIGKPKDENDAKNILRMLSGKTHFVATGLNITYTKKGLTTSTSDIEKTYVTFRDLSDNEIINYIKSSKPFDKAGAYGIQDEAFTFASATSGNIDNVIGFPMTLFNKLLNSIN